MFSIHRKPLNDGYQKLSTPTVYLYKVYIYLIYYIISIACNEWNVHDLSNLNANQYNSYIIV